MDTPGRVVEACLDQEDVVLCTMVCCMVFGLLEFISNWGPRLVNRLSQKTDVPMGHVLLQEIKRPLKFSTENAHTQQLFVSGVL